jgi:hypothetical protein
LSTTKNINNEQHMAGIMQFDLVNTIHSAMHQPMSRKLEHVSDIMGFIQMHTLVFGTTHHRAPPVALRSATVAVTAPGTPVVCHMQHFH